MLQQVAQLKIPTDTRAILHRFEKNVNLSKMSFLFIMTSQLQEFPAKHWKF